MFEALRRTHKNIFPFIEKRQKNTKQSTPRVQKIPKIFYKINLNVFFRTKNPSIPQIVNKAVSQP